MPIVRGTTLELRSDRYSMIEKAAIKAWVRGQAFTQAALLEAVARDAGTTISSGNANYHLAQLARRGQYVSQPAKFGAKGEGRNQGRPSSPYIINIGRVDVAATTLRNAVERYFADADVVKSRKHALRSALRFNFGLAEQASEGQILSACEAVPASKLYGFARQVYELALARPLSKKTAANHATAVSQMLRYAAERRCVPIVFPRFVEQDAWAEAMDRYWPLPPEGKASSETIARRRAWYAYADMAKEVMGDERTPDSITREEADSVVKAFERHGRLSVAYQVRTMLRRLASGHRTGPYVGATALDPFLIDTPTGPRSAIMLRGGGPGWDGLIACLRDHGCPETLTEYLTWYGVYITMPASEILAHRALFPHRRQSHRLGTASLDLRAQGLRAYFGAALFELQLDPASLTPVEAFGYQFDRTAGALIGWWNRRREALEDGSVGSAQAASLHKYIVGASMMCYTLYERLRFDRRLRIAERRSRTGKSTLLDARREEGSTKTPDEQAVWDAFVSGGAIGEDLKASAMERLGVSNKGNVPEIRNIHRILEHTGPEWWVTLLNRLITRFRELKRRGLDDGIEYHRLVQTAYEVGFYISTGCRNEEGCITRRDMHYTLELHEKRQIAFAGRDRKNRKETRVQLHADYVPDDLRTEYETRTLAYFTRDNHLARGRAPVPAHPFLLVNERGKPYGFYYEDMDAAIAAVPSLKKAGESAVEHTLRVGAERRRVKERFERVFKQHANAHGQRLLHAMARYAVEFKLKLPDGLYEFGLHPLRIACGYAIYLLEGRAAAAAYLGDTEDTAIDSYSAINGINVDSRCLLAAANAARERAEREARPSEAGGDVIADSRPLDSRGPAASTPTDENTGPGGYAARLAALIDAKRRGDIDAEEFALAKADLKASSGRVRMVLSGG